MTKNISKVAILDKGTASPAEYEDALRGQVDYMLYPDADPDALRDALCNAEIIIVDLRITFHAALFAALPHLRCLCTLSTGTNHIDLRAAQKQGIIVCNVQGYSTESVAQTTFALLFELTQHVGHHTARVQEGAWQKTPHRLVELSGKTMGIIGLGRIGSRVAEIAKIFGMTVLAHTRQPKEAQFPWIKFVPLDTLLLDADIVTLHVPLTDETRGLINAHKLGLMKKTAYLINTSRGDVIVEADLANALQKGTIAGAGLDVLSQEPPAKNNLILQAPNCFITPHLGCRTEEAQKRLLKVTGENVRAFLHGAAQNVITPG